MASRRAVKSRCCPEYGQGDVIVTEGSFFVRAERGQSGPRTLPAEPASDRAGPDSSRKAGEEIQTANITVGVTSFEPSRVTLRAGIPARVTFTRTTDKTCATDVVFPSLAIERALPFDQPVVMRSPRRRAES